MTFYSAVSRFLLVVLIMLAMTPPATFAASGGQPQAVVATRGTVAIGEELEFDATRSFNPFAERPIVFNWDFGDGSFVSGEKVAHVYQQPGTYEAQLTLRVGDEIDTVSFPVLVYERAILFVVGDAAREQQVQTLAASVRDQNIFLDFTRGINPREGFLAEEGAIAAALQEKLETLKSATTIVLWADGGDGLNGLTKFAQQLNPPLDFSTKRVVVITDDNIDTLARIARGTFAALQPQQILLTESDALRDTVLIAPDADLGAKLAEQAILYRTVDSGLAKFSLTAPLAFLVNYLISEGIPASAILLVLLLPVIATLVAFIKQVVGLTTFGVYTPSVLTLSFLTIGLKLGLVVLLVIVLVSVATRKLLKHYRLAYTPRLAIVLTTVSLAILAAIALLTWLAPLGNYPRIADLITAAIFPMLIMSTLAEKFVSIQTEKGSRSAVQMFLEVTFIAVACYLVVGEWRYLQTLMLATPEVIFLFLLADILLGRFTGLRLTEYFRFHDVLKKAKEEE